MWFDANTNGIQNAGETGVSNVAVRLYDGASNLVATTTNNAAGYYSFSGLQPGNYFLEFVSPSNYVFTLQDQGASDTNDSDVAQSTGRTPVFYLAPGTNDLKWDAGLVQPTFGLRITKTSNAGGDCWDPGETGTYTIVVVNTGAFSQVGVAVQDVFPSGCSFVTNTVAVRGPGAGSTGSPPTLAFGWTLASGRGMTVTVNFAVSKPATTNTLVNQAATYSATHPAIYAWATDCVVYADLGVIKDVSDATPNEVEIMEYSITITNNGPDTATGVEIEDVLPTQVQYNSHSNGAYDINSSIWTIGTLPVGSATTLWVNCTVREGTKFTYITNWARVHALDQYDPVSTNDQDDAAIYPTLVVLSRFEIVAGAAGPVVEWETSYEHGTVGFLLFRKQDGAADFVRLNERLLPGVITAPQGGVYRFPDESAAPERTYSYRLDEVTFDGAVNSYGPFTLTVPPAPARAGKALPSAEPYSRAERTSPSTRDRLAQAVAEEEVATASARHPARAKRGGGALDSGWAPVKVRTCEPGVYRLDAAALAEAVGADEAEVAAAIAANDVALDIGGKPAAYLADGAGLLFYAGALDSIYTTINVCRVTWSGGSGMSEVGGIFPVPVEGGSFTDVYRRERDRVALPAVEQEAESDYWYEHYLLGGDPGLGSKDYELDPPGAAGEGDAQLVVRLMGGSATGTEGEHHVEVSLNGTPLGGAVWSGLAPCAFTGTFSSALLGEENTVTLSALLGPGAPWSVVYVDSFELAYRRRYAAVGDQLLLRAGSSRVVSVTGFSNADIRVLDVTDSWRPVRLTGVSVDALDGGYRASFAPRGAETPYLVFAAGRAPLSLEAREPADLLAESNTARYIVITAAGLAGPAQALADYRQSQEGRPARVVVLDDVYDGFSFGVEHPPALRDFLLRARDHWNTDDTNEFFVVLAGEGTFDYRNVTGDAQNRVPVMMVSTPQGLCASDGWYADFDGDHVPDMAVGRLPAVSEAELQRLVDRIIGFESAEGGAWRQTVLLAADNPDAGGNFDKASDAVGDLAPRDYAVEKVYLSRRDITDTRAALQDGINGGAAFVNYFGHAGIDRLAQEGILRVSDVEALANSNRLPVVVSLTCAMGQFALPGFDCLGESLLMNAGGAIAVWAPNGVSLNHSSFGLADRLYRAVFRQGCGVLGDAVRRAMRDYAALGGSRHVLDSYNLLGDPALRLRGAAFAGDYAAWRKAVFTAEDLADPALSADDADPDDDGLGHLWEYALGWSPRLADAGQVLWLTREGGLVPPAAYDAVFCYQRRRNADVDFVLEGSADLSEWADAAGYVAGTQVADDGNGLTETVSVYVIVPSDDVGAGLFLRLAVARD